MNAEIQILARTALTEIEAFYAVPENQKAFKEWLEKKKKKQKGDES